MIWLSRTQENRRRRWQPAGLLSMLPCIASASSRYKSEEMQAIGSPIRFLPYKPTQWRQLTCPQSLSMFLCHQSIQSVHDIIQSLVAALLYWLLGVASDGIASTVLNVCPVGGRWRNNDEQNRHETAQKVQSFARGCVCRDMKLMQCITTATEGPPLKLVACQKRDLLLSFCTPRSHATCVNKDFSVPLSTRKARQKGNGAFPPAKSCEKEALRRIYAHGRSRWKDTAVLRTRLLASSRISCEKGSFRTRIIPRACLRFFSHWHEGRLQRRRLGSLEGTIKALETVVIAQMIVRRRHQCRGIFFVVLVGV